MKVVCMAFVVCVLLSCEVGGVVCVVLMVVVCRMYMYITTW